MLDNLFKKQIENFVIFYFLNTAITLTLLIFSVNFSIISLPVTFLLLVIYIFFTDSSDFLYNLLFFLLIFFITYFLSKNIIFSFGADYLTNHSKSFFFLFHDHNPLKDWSENLITWENEIIKPVWYYGEYIGFWGGAITASNILKFFSDNTIRLTSQFPSILFILYIYSSFKISKVISNFYLKVLFLLFIIFNPIIFGIIGSGYFDMYLPLAMIINTYLVIEFLANRKFKYIYLIFFLSALVSITRLDTFIFMNIYNLFLLISLFSFKKIEIFEKTFLLSLLSYFLIILVITSNPILRIAKSYVASGFDFENIIQDTNMWYDQGTYLQDNNRYQIFLDSILSPTAGNPQNHPQKIQKIKTLLDFSEIKTMVNTPPTDLRTGGFGPFWGFSFLLSVFLSLIIIWRKNNSKEYVIYILFFLTNVILISLTRYPFILRYVSFIYFFPIVAPIYIFIKEEYFGFYTKTITYFLMLLIFINTVLVAGTSIYRQYYLNNILKKHYDLYEKINYSGNYVTLENFHGQLLQFNFINKEAKLSRDINIVNYDEFMQKCEVYFRSYKTPFFLCVDEINKNKENIIIENCNLIKDIPYNTNFNKKYIFKNDYPLLWEIIDKKNPKKINCS